MRDHSGTSGAVSFLPRPGLLHVSTCTTVHVATSRFRSLTLAPSLPASEPPPSSSSPSHLLPYSRSPPYSTHSHTHSAFHNLTWLSFSLTLSHLCVCVCVCVCFAPLHLVQYLGTFCAKTSISPFFRHISQVVNFKQVDTFAIHLSEPCTCSLCHLQNIPKWVRIDDFANDKVNMLISSPFSTLMNFTCSDMGTSPFTPYSHWWWSSHSQHISKLICEKHRLALNLGVFLKSQS